jgi:hypothetical protein
MRNYMLRPKAAIQTKRGERLQRADCVEKLSFHLKTAKNFVTERQLGILARGSAKSIGWRCAQLYQGRPRK